MDYDGIYNARPLDADGNPISDPIFLLEVFDKELEKKVRAWIVECRGIFEILSPLNTILSFTF